MQIAEAYRVLGAAKAHAPPGSPQLLLNAVDNFLWNTRGQMCVGDVKVRLKQARCKAEKHQIAAAFQWLVLQGLILDEVIARCRPKVQFVHATVPNGLALCCFQQTKDLPVPPQLLPAWQADSCLHMTGALCGGESTCLLTGRCPCSLFWSLAASWATQQSALLTA